MSQHDEIPFVAELRRELVDAIAAQQRRAAAAPDGGVAVPGPGRARGSRWPRRRLLLTGAAVVVAAAAVVVAGLVPRLAGRDSTAAAAALNQAAKVATTRPSQRLQPGQYWYSRTRETQLVTIQPYRVRWTITSERWVAPDGSGRERRHVDEQTFPSEADRQAWIAAGRPDPDVYGMNTDDRKGPGGYDLVELGSHRPSYDELLALPTNPIALAGVLRREAEQTPATPGSTTHLSVEQKMLGNAISLLRGSVTPPAVRGAAYRVAASLPGLRQLGAVTSATGRSGVAVAISDRYTIVELVFDPGTSELLSERQTLVRPDADLHLPRGGVIHEAVFIASGVVGSTSATVTP